MFFIKVRYDMEICKFKDIKIVYGDTEAVTRESLLKYGPAVEIRDPKPVIKPRRLGVWVYLAVSDNFTIGKVSSTLVEAGLSHAVLDTLVHDAILGATNTSGIPGRINKTYTYDEIKRIIFDNSDEALDSVAPDIMDSSGGKTCFVVVFDDPITDLEVTYSIHEYNDDALKAYENVKWLGSLMPETYGEPRIKEVKFGVPKMPKVLAFEVPISIRKNRPSFNDLVLHVEKGYYNKKSRFVASLIIMKQQYCFDGRNNPFAYIKGHVNVSKDDTREYVMDKVTHVVNTLQLPKLDMKNLIKMRDKLANRELFYDRDHVSVPLMVAKN